jgi:IS1 family transposase
VGYLEPTLLPAQANDVLEVDELWSYVGSKKKVVWIWLVLCRRTRQIIAWHPGSREASTGRQLWHKIPASYKQGLVFTDFYKAYEAVVPQEQHRPGGKEEGQTNHIERFNLTIRQRVGRLTRKTLSFSKQHLWHYRHIRLFLTLYNLQRKNLYRHKAITL